MLSRNALVHLVGSVLVLNACDKGTSPMEKELGQVVVLNGQGETGISVLPDDGGTPVLLSFSDFDGASFSLRNDTVASAASKSKGDLLYVADLESKRVVKVQMPAGSNPGGAAFGNGIVFGPTGGVGTVIFVALRDLGQVGRVLFRNTGGAPVVEMLTGAGLCPVDVVVTSTAVWALDANQRCYSDYAVIGPSRLVPIPSMGSSDTINFLSAVVSAQRAFVIGNHAYVMSAGDYFVIPGAVSKVDLTTRNQVVSPLPDGYFGVSMRIGQNGFAYVTAAEGYPAEFRPRVYAINLETMAFGGVRMLPDMHIRLVKSSGAEAFCYAATADAAGNVYCLENGDVLSRLLVFNPAGDQIRNVPAGSLAYDLTLR